MIKVQQYNEKWPESFEKEKKRILNLVKQWVVDIEHVGSTAVPGMSSKPTIDMCMIVKTLELADQHIIERLENFGYHYIQEFEKMIPDRRYLQKLNANDEHLFHIHIVCNNSKRCKDYLLFRDYLREHPKEAKKYVSLKHKLSKEFTSNREAYTEGKAAFIRKLLDQAEIWHKQKGS